MKIGLLLTCIGDFGQKGFYNAQEIGLAKELDKIFEQVIIYKTVPKNQKKSYNLIDSCKHSFLKQLPANSIGNNGFIDLNKLDRDLDVLVYFCDMQLMVLAVYKWTQRNGIRFIPYIGVIESHSTNQLKRKMMGALFQRNLRVYRQCYCLVKTPKVEAELHNMKVQQIKVTPVGLDLSLMKSDYRDYSIEELKKKHGYAENEKIILFIGRMVAEKQPCRMVGIFDKLLQHDQQYRLLMVGTGELKDTVKIAIHRCGINNAVRLIDRIPNNEIWELYRIADAFVNLNQQEIFGMAILEAMYYECKVVAWNAPGPNLIIEDQVSGYLVELNESVADRIKDSNFSAEEAHQRVMEHFTWTNLANTILKLLGCN